MKKILFIISIFSIFLMYSCEKDDDSNVKPKRNSVIEDCIDISVTNETANFSASCASPDDSLSWDFGDGNISSEIAPVHTYNDTGSYEVNLTIVKSNNIKYTSSDSIRIAPTCKICECSFPMTTEIAYMSFCGTSTEAINFCATKCASNNYCYSCYNQ